MANREGIVGRVSRRAVGNYARDGKIGVLDLLEAATVAARRELTVFARCGHGPGGKALAERIARLLNAEAAGVDLAALLAYEAGREDAPAWRRVTLFDPAAGTEWLIAWEGGAMVRATRAPGVWHGADGRQYLHPHFYHAIPLLPSEEPERTWCCPCGAEIDKGQTRCEACRRPEVERALRQHNAELAGPSPEELARDGSADGSGEFCVHPDGTYGCYYRTVSPEEAAAMGLPVVYGAEPSAGTAVDSHLAAVDRAYEKVCAALDECREAEVPLPKLFDSAAWYRWADEVSEALGLAPPDGIQAEIKADQERPERTSR